MAASHGTIQFGPRDANAWLRLGQFSKAGTRAIAVGMHVADQVTTQLVAQVASPVARDTH